MSLSEEERTTLVSLHLEKAGVHLNQADEMCRMKYFDMAANRYYYSCFHALHALMLNDGIICKTHIGLIGEFGKRFIKTGQIAEHYGQFISRLEQLRTKGDYNCVYDVTEHEVSEMAPLAHEFVEMIKERLM